MLRSPRFTIATVLAILAFVAPTAAFAMPDKGPILPGDAHSQLQDAQRHQAGAAQKPPVYWSYDYAAGDPSDVRAAHAGDDDDIPWTAIALSVAGTLVLVGCTAAGAVAFRVRRTRLAA